MPDKQQTFWLPWGLPIPWRISISATACRRMVKGVTYSKACGVQQRYSSRRPLFFLCCHVLPHLPHSQACCRGLCSTWSMLVNSLHAHTSVLHAQAPMHQQPPLLSLYLLMLVACGYHGDTHAHACHLLTRISCLALCHSSSYF